MADLSNYIIPDNSPALGAVGAVFTVCLTGYLTVIMMRRIWHKRQRQVERTANHIVLRELCKLFDIMLLRLGDCPRRDIIHGGEGPDDDLAGVTSSSSLAEARAARATPTSSFTRIQLQPATPMLDAKMARLSSPIMTGTLLGARTEGSWEPRNSLADVSAMEDTRRRAAPRSGAGHITWRRLLQRDVRNFLDLETTALLTEQEREEVVVHSLQRLHRRCWFVQRDMATMLVQRATETHYHACCHQLFEEYLRFTIILHRIQRYAIGRES